MGNFGYTEFIIVAFAVVGSAIIKNGVGIGAGIFLLPFLSLVFPSKLALGLGAPAMLVSDFVGVKNYWKEWNKNELLLLLPPAFLGVLVGALVIKVIPGEIFKFGVGVIAILFSCFQLGKLSFIEKCRTTDSIPNTTTAEKHLTLLFGFLGGIASTVIHAGGMVMSIYLIQKPKDKRAFVGTFVLFFAIVNLLKLITYLKIGILTPEIALLVAAISPMIIFGGLFGNSLNKRISQKLFRVIVLAVILIIGVRLLLQM